MFNRSYIMGHQGHPHYTTDAKIMFLLKTATLSMEEEQLARIIRNLSDPTKLKLYLVLHKVKEIPVADLTQILGLSQSAISHALSDLKNLSIVESHRCGQLICYSLSKDKKSKKILNFFDGLLAGVKGGN